jgi:hypothetical protein
MVSVVHGDSEERLIRDMNDHLSRSICVDALTGAMNVSTVGQET